MVEGEEININNQGPSDRNNPDKSENNNPESSETPGSSNTGFTASGISSIPAASGSPARDDNRDEYYYKAPENRPSFEGATKAGESSKQKDTSAGEVKYDYYKSYPSYGPGAPYADHEKGSDPEKSDLYNETKEKNK